MSEQPFVRSKFIPSESLLPEKLQLGRIYFVADKKYIVCDNGQGPVIYSSFIQPPAPDSGVTDQDYENQIDELAESILNTHDMIYYLWANSDKTDKEQTQSISQLLSDMSAVQTNISSLGSTANNHEGRIENNEDSIEGLEIITNNHETRINTAENDIELLTDLAAEHEGRISENTENVDELFEITERTTHAVSVLKEYDEILQEQNDELSESILEFANHLLYIENLN